MIEDIKEVLVSNSDIEKIADELAVEITKDYRGKNPLLVGLLKGCMIFMADISKRLDFHIELDYMDVSSYAGVTSTGIVSIDRDLKTDVKNRDVLIVEDIVDTGRTLEKIIQVLKDRGAKSVKIATLLDKPDGRIVNLKAEYVGRVIPNAFVVGYGLDYDEKYRNLPYVGILKEEIYKK